MNLTTHQRTILIEEILVSDARYLDKLISRKQGLLLDLHILEGNIQRKVQEIQGMQAQLEWVTVSLEGIV